MVAVRGTTDEHAYFGGVQYVAWRVAVPDSFVCQPREQEVDPARAGTVAPFPARCGVEDYPTVGVAGEQAGTGITVS